LRFTLLAKEKPIWNITIWLVFNVRTLFVDVGVKKLNILFVEGLVDDVAREPS